MNDFFGVTASGPFFFVSAWALMIFAGIGGSDVGIRPFGYVTSETPPRSRLTLRAAPQQQPAAQVRTLSADEQPVGDETVHAIQPGR